MYVLISVSSTLALHCRVPLLHTDDVFIYLCRLVVCEHRAFVSLQDEESSRTLNHAPDVDERKERFDMKNTHTVTWSLFCDH